ncbi:MAG: hypothetical protein MSA90_15265 [Faecalicatena sp.]|uniref:hypothetical protein n=1 Tax=Faecalicatena sp. TaxID=2005360 RepID=UPI002582D88A|nr:hypothetical protein [Faecalicatena sp.]MCI6466811.1 hypothetical protein [Faecalicatena sp.]MCI7181994.1 hypothetical protein [Lachnospiraceae bacterium]MDY5619146.1 hypothetical protein [Lachnospiraceae bacterium]
MVNMLIAEYDYDMDIEVQREETYAEGVEKGKSDKLKEIIKKKLLKGISPEEIAEDMEESVEEVKRIINLLDEFQSKSTEDFSK